MAQSRFLEAPRVRQADGEIKNKQNSNHLVERDLAN